MTSRSRTLPRPRTARAAAAVVLAVALGLAGCGGSADTAAGPTTSPADGAATVPGLPAGTVLIDVRLPEEFDTGHLEGALNLPVELEAFADQVAALDPDAEYLVYCRSGRRADLAVAYMTELGLDARNLGSVAEASAETGVPVVG